MLDFYCIGCLLYELVYSAPPFYSKCVEDIYDSVVNDEVGFPPYPETSPEFKHFLVGLLVKDPKERLGFRRLDDIFEHPFLKGASEEMLSSPPFVPRPFNSEIVIPNAQDLENSSELGRIRLYQDFLDK